MYRLEVFSSSPSLQPVKADEKVPCSGTSEEYLNFLSSLRNTRDTVSERQSEISHELHSAHEVAKLQELRLALITNTLNALEDVIGEVRARLRARGITVYPTRGQLPNTTATTASSAGVVEEVSILHTSLRISVRF